MVLTTLMDEEAGSVRLAVSGEIDIANIDEFDAALCALISDSASAVLDLTEVTHFGSTAIGALICAHTLAGERAVRMVIRPSPIVRRVLEITRLDRTFALADAVA